MNRAFWAWLVLGLMIAPWVSAQEENTPPARKRLNLSGEFGLPPLGGGFGEDANVTFSATLQLRKDSSEGLLTITAQVPEQHHIYSINKGLAGQPTQFTLPAGELEQTGQFDTDPEPKREYSKVFMKEVEEQHGEIRWTAPVKLAAGADPQALKNGVKVRGQVCRDADANGEGGNCRPFSEDIPVTFGGYLAQAADPGIFRVDSSHVTWKGRLEPAVVSPGGKATLILRAEPDEGWHIYPYATEVATKTGAQPTLIALSKSSGWYWSEPVPINNPPLKAGIGGAMQYEGPVEWAITLKAPQTTSEEEQRFRGLIGFQLCAQGCTAPTAISFAVSARVSREATDKSEVLVEFAEIPKSATDKLSPYAKATALAKEFPPTLSTRIHWATLWPQLGLAIVGGLILNLMPCVLPVIGLKVLSFARQAGESRARILGLNVAYVGGLMLVFLALATAAAFLNWGWGEQFTSVEFRVAMTGLVFVMALSFLGTWQLPVPGFATSEKAGQLQNQHGYSGAFFKGMFTTVLATPCSGPFLGAVFGYTLTQPAIVTYLIFAAVGFGMGLPYLLVGFVPALVKFLPKPGEWMETFENVLGFVLLATVVYLMAITGQKYFIPTFALLIGLWFACWLIGRVPEYAGTGKLFATWGVASVLVAAVGWGSFTYLGPVRELYDWKPYNAQTLADLQKQGKTVMLDFTADWCATCQVNFRWAINTSRVKSVVEQNGVVPVKADWSDFSNEIKQKLTELESRSIPLLVIFPAETPDEPIILRDAVVESQVVKALEQAGPSRKPDAGKLQRSTAMREGGERRE